LNGVVRLANNEIGDRNAAIGPSHFLREDLDEQWIRDIWEHSILPYLAEQFFGQEARLKDFQLDRLRSRAGASGAVEENDGSGSPP
jgi:hypothetical protein